MSLGSSPFSTSGARMTFDGLMSRWMTPARCAASSAQHSRARDVDGAHRLELPFSQHRGQRRPRHVLHDEERRIADDEVEEAGDVAVLDRRDRLGLLLEAPAELRVERAAPA